jgi:hypothetical protein
VIQLAQLVFGGVLYFGIWRSVSHFRYFTRRA